MDITTLVNRSYVPYSGKPSVSVVRSVDNHYFPGVRIENASFPLTISAIQNAVFNCLAAGERPKALYVEDPHQHTVEYWKLEYRVWVYSHEELDEFDLASPLITLDKDEIQPALIDLLDNAKVANSDFPVSVLLETPEGFVPGVNIETSEWSFGLCAERVAIARALAHGITDFRGLYIHTRNGEFSSPCGACRQSIVEHLPQKQLHLHHADHTVSSHFIEDLLPYGFHSSNLTEE